MDENEDREQRLHDARMAGARKAHCDAIDAARYRFIRDCDQFNGKRVMDGGRAGMMIGNWREDLDRAVDDAMERAKKHSSKGGENG